MLRDPKLSERMRISTDAVSGSVCQLVALERGLPHLVASGVLVQCLSKRYLITAGHAYDRALETGQKLQILTNVGLKKVKAAVFRLNAQSGEYVNNFDVCVYSMPKKFSETITNHRFLSFSEVIFRHRLTANDEYFVLGFPASRSKTSKRKRMVMSECKPLFTRVSSEKSFISAKVNPATHILVDYPRKVVNSTSEHEFFTPKPMGMSGGGLFLAKNLSKLDEELHAPCLLGINIEYINSNGQYMINVLRLDPIFKTLRLKSAFLRRRLNL